MVGTQELWDQVVGDRTLHFGTAAFEAHLDEVLDESFEPFRAVGSRLAVTNVPCHKVPDYGTVVDAKVINDESRVRLLNRVIARYAAKRADVHLVDLHGRLCGNGFAESVDGIELRTDGLHLSPAGARFVWQWLEPQLESSALASTVPSAR